MTDDKTSVRKDKNVPDARRRQRNDPPGVLYKKVMAKLELLGEGFESRQSYLNWAKTALDSENRVALINYLRDLSRFVRNKAEEDAMIQRYLVVSEPVRNAWQEAKMAYAEWVRAENEKGHQGQKAADMAFFNDFLALQLRVGKLWPDGRDDIEPLLADILEETELVRNFVQNWCKKPECGTPIDDWIEVPGKKGFKPDWCKPHIPPKKNKPASEVSWSVPEGREESRPSKSGRDTKKPGSAKNRTSRGKSPEEKAKLKIDRQRAAAEKKVAEELALQEERVHSERFDVMGASPAGRLGSKKKNSTRKQAEVTHRDEREDGDGGHGKGGETAGDGNKKGQSGKKKSK